MEFDQDNVGSVVEQEEDIDQDNVGSVVEQEEDRLSSLPDELIRNIMSCIDMKFAVQMCLLSSRWKLLWTSIPCLKFSSREFRCLPKFSEFVNNVLDHRNHQIQVSSIKLLIHGNACQILVRKIANYAFSHNVQQLEVGDCVQHYHEFPPCLFSSQSLKHFTLSRCSISPRGTPTRPLDFPVLTTLHLKYVLLCDSVDNFSKCVNLKNLKLEHFELSCDVEVFDIITPRLSNLIFISGRYLQVVNVIAPQLENLTIINTRMEYLNAPAGISFLFYKCYDPPLQLSNDRFHSLNQVNICFTCYKREHARRIIKILQELHSVRYLTLSVDMIDCISSFSNFLSHLPSPFGNLICLSIDSNNRKDAYNVRMSTEARNFLFENSPNATFTIELPEILPEPAVVASATQWWSYVRNYTFTSSSTAIVDDSVNRKNKKDKKKKKKKRKEKKKKLSRLDAVMVIQMAFRAFVIRRCEAIRALRELAVAKGEKLKYIWAYQSKRN